jgi:hypothetical protein
MRYSFDGLDPWICGRGRIGWSPVSLGAHGHIVLGAWYLVSYLPVPPTYIQLTAVLHVLVT